MLSIDKRGGVFSRVFSRREAKPFAFHFEEFVAIDSDNSLCLWDWNPEDMTEEEGDAMGEEDSPCEESQRFHLTCFRATAIVLVVLVVLVVAGFYAVMYYF